MRSIREIIVVTGVRFTWLFLMGLSGVAFGIDCAKLQARMDKISAVLEKLTKTQAQLNAKFSESVERDLSNQVEGVLDELNRSKSLKVAFAKKRLARKIDEMRMEAKVTRKSLCESCSDKLKKEEAAQKCGIK